MTESPPPVQETSDGQALLVEYLNQHEDACPRCGYNLKMLTGDRCPECGDQLELRVGLVEARLGVYITAVVGCCLGFGGGVFLMTIILFYAPSSYWQKSLTPWLLIGQIVVTGVLMAVLLTRRPWFTKKTRGRQIALTVLVWVVTLGMSGLSLLFFDT